MRAEIVMIGTELLLGEIVDTNAARLALGLRSIGLDLYYKTTVGDNLGRIIEVLNHALERSDVIITSGGLGPTVDDMTREAVAAATGRPLVYSHELEQQIAARFRSFGREMADNNKRQAFIPEGALPLRNPVGTAPCFLSEDAAGRGFIISLPGVPRELDYMLEHSVLPLLVERMGGKKALKVRVLRTCAVGESNIDRAIGDLEELANPTVGLAAHAGQTDVRITAKANTEAEAEALIAPVEAELRRRLGVAIYGVDKETVPGVVGQLLVERGLRIGVIDTLSRGLLVRDLIDAGFGGVIAADLQPASVAAALAETRVSLNGNNYAALARAVAPAGGLGVALLGPFDDDRTLIVVEGADESQHLAQAGRKFQDSDYVRRWFATQGLDWVRRVLLNQLSSPADWN